MLNLHGRKWYLLPSLGLIFFLFGVPRPAASRDNWVEVKSPNFLVVSNSGEGEARKIADQFEKFREMFRVTFPGFRVDLGKPLIILAVKNEDGMKVLLPGYWEAKGRVHPDGLFASGEERDMVAVRTNVETEYPYQVVYHEYTHALMDVNYRGLPIWLGEGLAEYFGNSTILDKEVRVGKIPGAHLQILQTNRLIPIDILLQADAHSPYYNEQNRVSVFYAESWAIVHYLMLDPEARKQQLLATFLKQWDATGDQVMAAQKTFGDLKKFAALMERYARQDSFYVSLIRTTLHADAKSYPVRSLSPAEVAAYSGLFLFHTARFQEAQTQTAEALKIDPNLALAHETSGLIAYQKQEYGRAREEFQRATELSATSSPAYYYLALSRMRGDAMALEQMSLITASLEKALELNPHFAPAYLSLSQFYSMRPETHEKAFAMGKKAIELVPGNLRYATSFGYVLLNMGKIPEAQLLADRIQAAARDPQEIQMADSLRQAARQRASIGQGVDIQPKAGSDSAPPKSTDVSIADSGKGQQPAAPTASPAANPSAATTSHIARGPDYRLEGKVTAADCKPGGGLTVTFTINTVLMKFHATDWKSVEITPDAKAISAATPSCSAWKSQRAEVIFQGNPAGEFDGELVAIHFR